MTNAGHAKVDGLSGRGVSPKAFMTGFVAGLVLLALYAAWLWGNAGAIETTRLSRLASATVVVTGISAQDNTQNPAQVAAVPPTGQAGNAAPVTEEKPKDSAPEIVALSPAPVPDLVEASPDGPLPVTDIKTGQTPFQAYRRPFDKARAAGKPVIALMVANVGLSQAATDAAMKDFPPQISMALSPYATGADDLVKAMRIKGHEVWLTLPMQGPAYPRVDPGPYTLLSGVSSEDNLKKLKKLMGHAVGYVGLIGTHGADFSATASDFKPIIDAIDKRGLGYIDPSSTVRGASDHPDSAVDVWFPRSASQNDIDAALKKLEDIAKTNGHALGALPPMPLVFDAVRKWLPTLLQNGFILVPASAIAAPSP